MPNSSATVIASAGITATKSYGNFGNSTIGPLNFNSGKDSFGSGSGAGNFNSAYVGSRTVSNGTPDTLNLTSGLTNPDGTAAVFADIVAIGITNNSTVAGQNLEVGAGTDAVSTIMGATGVIKIPPGGTFIISNPAAVGYGITTTTADRININVDAGTAVPYDIFILGH